MPRFGRSPRIPRRRAWRSGARPRSSRGTRQVWWCQAGCGHLREWPTRDSGSTRWSLAPGGVFLAQEGLDVLARPIRTGQRAGEAAPYEMDDRDSRFARVRLEDQYIILVRVHRFSDAIGKGHLVLGSNPSLGLDRSREGLCHGWSPRLGATHTQAFLPMR